MSGTETRTQEIPETDLPINQGAAIEVTQEKVDTVAKVIHQDEDNSFVTMEEGVDADDRLDAKDVLNANVKQWSLNAAGAYSASRRSNKQLPSGEYNIQATLTNGVVFTGVKPSNDDLLLLPDSIAEEVIEDLQAFWDNKEKYEKCGLVYRRGIFLYGPPGGGKTSTLSMVAQLVKKNNGIIFRYSGNINVMKEGLKIFRKIQPNTPVVVLMEDLDDVMSCEYEPAVLSLLDGQEGIDNVVFIATTNYPERLAPRVINRPSRFDRRFKITMPSAEARRLYFNFLADKHGEQIDNLDQWVKDTDGLSVAHLKELFISTQILGQPYDQTIVLLNTMKEGISSAQDYDEVDQGEDDIPFDEDNQFVDDEPDLVEG